MRPISGPDKVARFLIGISRDGLDGLEVRVAAINGQTGLIGLDGARPTVVALAEVSGGLVSRVFIITNPEKLSGVAG